MKEIFTLALAATVEGLKLANTLAARKTAGRIEDVRLEILAEENRGYDSDDAKLETLYKELAVLLQTARDEINALLASRST